MFTLHEKLWNVFATSSSAHLFNQKDGTMFYFLFIYKTINYPENYWHTLSCSQLGTSNGRGHLYDRQGEALGYFANFCVFIVLYGKLTQEILAVQNAVGVVNSRVSFYKFLLLYMKLCTSKFTKTSIHPHFHIHECLVLLLLAAQLHADRQRIYEYYNCRLLCSHSEFLPSYSVFRKLSS